ncbi:MAG: DUF4833 domain-containing protein [Saprospiraceae bacterium]|nr:DUF4833 domain-containing protein [Saprospiraceae bacterium]
MNKTFYQSFLDKTYEPQGLPSDYPVPDKEGLLFYIQRNQNYNTVVYEVNKTELGDWNMNDPMKVYWIKYNQLQEECELNYIQNKLAYGYNSQIINNDLIEFSFVSYKKQFFIQKVGQNDFRVITDLSGSYAYLNNMYVYAEEFGVFPEVKFVELFGMRIDSMGPCYEKIIP